jgi:hypothetical protein
MKARRSRTARPTCRRYRLMPRDTEILFAVGRMAQSTSDQLCRLFFGDRSTGYRRLAKLVALRLLKVSVYHQDEPNVYSLRPEAINLLVESGMERQALYLSRVKRHLDVHLKCLNDVRLELVLAARTQNDMKLESFHSDLDLRRMSGIVAPAYIPDAIAELQLVSGPLALIIEIDLGSEGLSVFASKIEATVILWRREKRCWGAAAGRWRPVVFVPSTVRARALARTIVELGGGALWLLAEFKRLREQGAFGPIFASATDIAATPSGARVMYRGALTNAMQKVPL